MTQKQIKSRLICSAQANIFIILCSRAGRIWRSCYNHQFSLVSPQLTDDLGLPLVPGLEARGFLYNWTHGTNLSPQFKYAGPCQHTCCCSSSFLGRSGAVEASALSVCHRTVRSAGAANPFQPSTSRRRLGTGLPLLPHFRRRL